MSWAGKQDLLCICFPKWSKVTRTVELDSYNLTVIWDQASYRNIGGRNLLLLHVMLNISCIWSSRIDVHIPPLCVLFVVHVCVFTSVYRLMYIYCAYCERAWKLFSRLVVDVGCLWLSCTLSHFHLCTHFFFCFWWRTWALKVERWIILDESRGASGRNLKIIALTCFFSVSFSSMFWVKHVHSLEWGHCILVLDKH